MLLSPHSCSSPGLLDNCRLLRRPSFHTKSLSLSPVHPLQSFAPRLLLFSEARTQQSADPSACCTFPKLKPLTIDCHACPPQEMSYNRVKLSLASKQHDPNAKSVYPNTMFNRQATARFPKGVAPRGPEIAVSVRLKSVSAS